MRSSTFSPSQSLLAAATEARDAARAQLPEAPARTDVAVIGAGLGGLTAAARLAHGGADVTVFERNGFAGGYYGALCPGDDVLDLAVSYHLSFNPGGAAHRVFDELGLLPELGLQRLQQLDRYHLADGSVFAMPATPDAFADALCARFPAEEPGIRRLLGWFADYHRSTQAMGRLPNRLIVQNFLKDYEPFVRAHVNDRELVNFLSMRIQADPASLFIMAGFYNEMLVNGMYYVAGGNRRLPELLAGCVAGHGGHVRLGDAVVRVGLDEQDALPYTLHLASGARTRARAVVVNISPFDYLRLLDPGAGRLDGVLARERDRVATRPVGHSSVSFYYVCSGTDLAAFDCGRMFLVPADPAFDVFDHYRRVEAGHLPAEPLWKVHVPSRYDPGLTRPGEAIVRVEADLMPDAVAGDGGEGRLEDLAARLDARCRAVVAQRLGGAIGTVERAYRLLPSEFAALTGNHRGSGTGWAHTVSNYFRNVYPTVMRIPGSYICGQWGELGSGLRQLVLTGERAAQAALAGARSRR